MESNRRLDWVDSAKGIGIILVTYGHIYLGLTGAGIVPKNSFFYIFIKFVYSFHMPLFFLLSGLFFEIGIRKRGRKAFMTEKVKTILYPFIIWSIIQTSIEIILSNYTNQHASLSSLFICLFVPKAQFWFLFALFLHNLLNTLLVYLFKEKWFLISLLLSIVLLELPMNYGLTFQRPINYLIYFNLGILLSKYMKSAFFYALTSNFAYLICSTILFIFTEYFYLFIKNGGLEWYFLIPQILGILFVIQVSVLLAKYDISIFKKIGKYSFQIFLLHILCAAGTRIILLKVFNIQNFTIHLLLATTIGVLLPIIIYKLLYKLKYFSWLFFYPNKKVDYNIQ